MPGAVRPSAGAAYSSARRRCPRSAPPRPPAARPRRRSPTNSTPARPRAARQPDGQRRRNSGRPVLRLRCSTSSPTSAPPTRRRCPKRSPARRATTTTSSQRRRPDVHGPAAPPPPRTDVIAALRESADSAAQTGRECRRLSGRAARLDRRVLHRVGDRRAGDEGADSMTSPRPTPTKQPDSPRTRPWPTRSPPSTPRSTATASCRRTPHPTSTSWCRGFPHRTPARGAMPPARR